jgi:hypothetical protein
MGSPQISREDEFNAMGYAGYNSGSSGSIGAVAEGENQAAFGDPMGGYNKQQLASALAARQAQPVQQMQAATLGPMQNAQGSMSGGSQINTLPQEQTRAQQMALGQQLARTASGQGPSVAQEQLKQATDQNIRQQQSLAASMRGVNPALAARNAQMGAASAQQQAAGQASTMRAQEALSAQGQLGGLLSGVRGQDIGLGTEQAQLGQQNQQFNAGQANALAQFNAGQQNQGTMQQGQFNQAAAQANLGAGVDQQKQLDEMTKYYTQNGLSIDQAQFAANQALASMKNNTALDRLRIQAGLSGQSQQANAQMAGAGTTAMAAAIPMILAAAA